MAVTWRAALVLAAILAYSAVVLSLDSVVLPAAGINGYTRIDSTTFSFLGPEFSGQAHGAAASGGPLADRRRKPNVVRLWLRPFGLHRPGLNDLVWAFGSFTALSAISCLLLFLFPRRVHYVHRLLRV
ncbi:MAG: hypothetical protein ACYDAG_06330, partial [Chloroflexota bacterium]